ncbi:MAG: hypothetical protein WDA22_12915 [Bacteroidota bacterium]
MKNINAFKKIFVIMLAVATLAANLVAGTFTNNGTFTNKVNRTATFTAFTNGAAGTTNNLGTLNVKGVLTQSAPAANFKTSTGTIGYTGNAAQDVLAGTSIDLGIYGGLALNSTGAFTKTLLGNATVAGGVALTGDASFTIGATQLTVTRTGSAIFSNTSTGSYTFTGGTVVYNATAAQTVFPSTYGNLTLSGGSGSVKTSDGDVTVNTVLTVDASNTLLVDGATGLADLILGAGADITNNGTINQADEDGLFTASDAGNAITNGASALIKIAGTASFTSNPTIGGTVEYYAAVAAQNIAQADYVNLTLTNAGSKDFAAVEYKVRQAFTSTGGTVTFAAGNIFHYSGVTADGGSQTVAALNNYREIKFSGDTDKNITGTLAAETLTNTSSSLNGVYIQGAGDVTISGTVTNDGTITNDGVLTVN